ncbi:hypothetical protein [Siminovitchia sp. 179-K 8D1 HS]|uniref:hypothetical protein n=1 Tax=Siminovitchia sp. 179-K 8D1 HS TaxID=3142385 RepID=UPI0039A0DF9D
MAIYYNDEEYPYIFKNKEEIDEPNQSIAKYDYWSDLVEEQKRVHSEINESLHGLHDKVHRQEHDQQQRWKKIYYRLNEQRKYNDKQNEFENYAKSRLENIESKNERLQAMLNEESQFKQVMMEKLHSLQKTHQEIENRLEKQEAINEHFLSSLHEQHELQKEMADQISKLEANHQEVIERLDSQEALTEKVLRQVTNLRSILFERAGHLADKIENSYKLTSSYIYKLMTGQVFLVEQKEKQKKDTD